MGCYPDPDPTSKQRNMTLIKSPQMGRGGCAEHKIDSR